VSGGNRPVNGVTEGGPYRNVPPIQPRLT
jgi:hypothetical protein